MHSPSQQRENTAEVYEAPSFHRGGVTDESITRCRENSFGSKIIEEVTEIVKV